MAPGARYARTRASSRRLATTSSGLAASPLGRLVSRMQRDPQDADYATGAVFTADEAAHMIGDAEAFVAEAHRLIDASGG